MRASKETPQDGPGDNWPPVRYPDAERRAERPRKPERPKERQVTFHWLWDK